VERSAFTPSVAPRDSSPVKGEREKLVRLAKKLRKNTTSHERKLWHDLKLIPNTRFRRQVVIDRYIVDFACFQSRLVIELDGSQHAEVDHARNDKTRDAYLKSQGFIVLRFWNFDNDEEQGAIIDTVFSKLGPRSPLTGELSRDATEGVTPNPFQGANYER